LLIALAIVLLNWLQK